MSDNNENYTQMTIFEYIQGLKADSDDTSSSDIDDAIEQLKKLRNLKKHREDQERIRREQKEKKRAEEKARLEQLRHIESVTSMELDMNWENSFVSDEYVLENRTESISDAYIKCLNQRACVDIEYIAALSSKSPREVIEKLRGSIYQNPLTWNECFYKGWETADEYLSGNIREKIIDAAEADRRYNGYFADNVKALKKVLPPEVSADDIYITLGSPWVPAEVIEDFIRHIEHREYGYRKVMHDELTGTWAFDFSCKDANCYVPYENREKFGTSRRNVYELLLKTLNMQNVAVYDSDMVYTDPFQKPKKVRKINKEETTLAFEKQKALIEEFQEWVWSDAKRKKRLESIYTEKYGSIKQRHFDGSFLELPGMNPEIV